MIPHGELVLVATPIGNLGDLAPRAIEALAGADVICCEDTRRSGRLLAHAGVVPGRLLSLHGHNERRRVEEVLGLLAAGRRVALVTDAGTPAVSDPGALLVDAAHDAGIPVRVVPGPSAATAAVALAGFVRDRWRFEGFVPRKGPERRARLAGLARSEVPSVIYEAPGRVPALLADLLGQCGPARRVAVCRELTKLHEETWRGSLAEAAARFTPEAVRGEFVLVLEAAPPAEAGPLEAGELAGELAALLAAGSSRRDAVAELAERHGLPRREIYEALALVSGPAGSDEASRESL
jgi:16S rRNA (cytidine1402-2'-O)-methyltransferase